MKSIEDEAFDALMRRVKHENPALSDAEVRDAAMRRRHSARQRGQWDPEREIAEVERLRQRLIDETEKEIEADARAARQKLGRQVEAEVEGALSADEQALLASTDERRRAERAALRTAINARVARQTEERWQSAQTVAAREGSVRERALRSVYHAHPHLDPSPPAPKPVVKPAAKPKAAKPATAPSSRTPTPIPAAVKARAAELAKKVTASLAVRANGAPKTSTVRAEMERLLAAENRMLSVRTHTVKGAQLAAPVDAMKAVADAIEALDASERESALEAVFAEILDLPPGTSAKVREARDIVAMVAFAKWRAGIPADQPLGDRLAEALGSSPTARTSGTPVPSNGGTKR